MTHVEELLLNRLETSRLEIGYYKGILAGHGIQTEPFEKENKEAPKVETKEHKIIKHNFRSRVS